MVVAVVAMLLTSGTASAGPAMPATINGLTVKQEDVSKTVAADKRPSYADTISMYSLRDNKNLLIATLEFAHLRPAARWKDEDFQQSVAAHVGGTIPSLIRVNGTTVYLVGGLGLQIAIWFRASTMCILSVRATYTAPRELLRQSLQVSP